MYKNPFRPKRQKTQYTCMACSLSMCLEANGINADEELTNKVMGAAPLKGARWEELIAAAQHFGCRATMITPATLGQLKLYTDQGIPCVISWNPEGRDWSHASVVYKVEHSEKHGFTVYVADPNLPDPEQTVRIMSGTEFYNKWYEKWSNYLVRRVCVAIENEITDDGMQRIAQSSAYTSDQKNKETDQMTMKLSIQDFEALLYGKEITKEAAGGLYGYTKRTQQDIDVAVGKIQRVATKLAKATYRKDERIAGFMALHAKRSKSAAAKIMVTAYSNLGPKIAKKAGLNREQIKILKKYNNQNMALDWGDVDFVTQGWLGRADKELQQDVTNWLSQENFGRALMAAEIHKNAALYGRNPKVVKMGLNAILELQTKIGEIANGLHTRRATKWNKLTAYMKQHMKATKCAYTSCLFNAYPEMPATKTAMDKSAEFLIHRKGKVWVGSVILTRDKAGWKHLLLQVTGWSDDGQQIDGNYWDFENSLWSNQNGWVWQHDILQIERGPKPSSKLQQFYEGKVNAFLGRTAADYLKDRTARYEKGKSVPLSDLPQELQDNANDTSKHFADSGYDDPEDFEHDMLAHDWGAMAHWEDEIIDEEIEMEEVYADSSLPNDDESDAVQPDGDMGYEPGETKNAQIKLPNGDKIEWLD